MDGMKLLVEARLCGLIVVPEGDLLVIRGPRSAEAIAQRLLAHKADVMMALAVECAVTTAGIDEGVQVTVEANSRLEWTELDEDAGPSPCSKCGGSDLWEPILGPWRCQGCDASALHRSRSLADKAARMR